MKRAWRFTSEAAQISRFKEMRHHLSNPKSIPPTTTAFINRRQMCTLQQPNLVLDLVSLFTVSSSSTTPDNYLKKKITNLRRELVREASDSVRVKSILDHNSEHLIRSHLIFLELLNQLNSRPSLALEVLLPNSNSFSYFTFIHNHRF